MSGWQDVYVEKAWREALPEDVDSKVAWYGLRFEVPELKDTGQRVYFGSIDAEVKIWINGKLVHE